MGPPHKYMYVYIRDVDKLSLELDYPSLISDILGGSFTIMDFRSNATEVSLSFLIVVNKMLYLNHVNSHYSMFLWRELTTFISFGMR